MAIDFPNSPAIGDIFTHLDRSWQWTGTQWVSVVTAPQPPYPGRNRILNGGMDVWQHGAGPFTTDNAYHADLWKQNNAGSTHSVSRVAFPVGNAIPGYEPTYFLRCVVASVAGAANRALIYQPIESVRTFAGQQCVFSFWARADAAKTIAVEMNQNMGAGGTPSTNLNGISPVKFPITTAWARYSVPFTIPSLAGKTLGTTHDGFLYPAIWFDAGANYDARTATLGQQSGTFDIWGAQLEAGSVATPFEVKPYADTLRDCQRYFWVAMSAALDAQIPMTRPAATMGFIHFFSPVPMRAQPTLAINGGGFGRCVFYDTGGGWGATVQTPTGITYNPPSPTLSHHELVVIYPSVGPAFVYASFDTAGTPTVLALSAEL